MDSLHSLLRPRQCTKLFTRCALLFSLLLTQTSITAQLRPTSPTEFLGRPVGTDRVLADWTQIGTFFDQLGERSANVEVKIVGTSTKGRPFRIAIVSSQENLSRLDEIRALSAQIADPRRLSSKEKDTLIKTATPIIFISCQMHSTEIAAAEMSMELAHSLATSEEEPWATARRQLVTVLIPTVNPDGLDDVVSWYRKIVGTPYESSRLPELYQLYAGHDNNRDWFALSLQETKIVTKLLYQEWYPQVYWDVHQQGSRRERLFVPPFRDPLNPNLDPAVIAGIGALGGRALLDLTREGYTGVSTGVTYDMWWNGGNRNVPVRHNIIGLLSEAASANLASPIFLSRDQLEAPRGIETGYAPSNRFPSPWPGGWWRIGDIIDYELALARSLLGSLSREPEVWLRGSLEVAERIVSNGQAQAPRGWVIPPGQDDGGALRRLIEILLAQGIEIGRASSSFQADGVGYPANTLVLSRAQPYGAFLRDLFEVQRYPDGPAPYDVAGWTLPFLFGVRRVEVVGDLEVETIPVKDTSTISALLAQPNPKSNRLPFGSPSKEQRPTDLKPVRGLSGRDSDTIGHLATLLSSGAEVVRSILPNTEIAGGWIPLDGWREKVRSAGGDPVPIESALQNFGETAQSIDARNLKPLSLTTYSQLPRVGIYAPWTASMDEGWLRWTFEHLKFPYQQIRNARVRAGRLSEDFEVLILPSIRASSLRDGRAKGSVFPELVGGLDPEGSIAIEEFVRSGGTLITCQSSCQYAIELLELPVEDVTRSEHASDFACPGSVLRTVPAPTNMTVGLPLSQSIFFSRSSAFRPLQSTADEPRRQQLRIGDWEPYLHFPASQVLLSGYLRAPETLTGAAAWGSFRVGKGRVHLFGFRPHYRSWSHGAFWLLFRAVLLSPTPSATR